jgi:Methylaspartate ammonia-lyase N-terminus
MRNLCFADCGSPNGNGFLSITDNGDNTCSAFKIEDGVPTVLDCNALAYSPNATCDTIYSATNIVFRRSTTAAYQQNMNKWLTNMGLASATIITNPLTIQFDHAAFPIPQFQAPTFFSNLLQVTC